MNAEKENATNQAPAMGPDTTAADEGSTVLKLTRAYHFEDKDIKEVDLSGLDNLKAEDMIAADNYMSRNGSISATPEMTVAYACFIASRVSALPLEFFLRLQAKDAVRLKNRVMGFFYSDD